MAGIDEARGDLKSKSEVDIQDIKKAMKSGKLSEMMDFSYVLDGWEQKRFSEVGIKRGDVSDVVEKTAKALGYAEDVRESKYKTRLSIKKLGKVPFKSDKKREEEYRAQIAAQMAKVLSSSPDGAFSLRAESFSNAQDVTDMRFTVSSEKLSANALESMIRGVYGRANTERVEGADRRFAQTFYGKARIMLTSKETLLKDRDEKPMQSWVSALLRSMPESRNYRAEIEFIPLLEEEELEALDKHILKLEEYYDTLAFYSEIGWNTSINTGTSINNATANALKSLLHNMKTMFTGDTKFSFNKGDTYSLSNKEISQQMKSLSEELECEILRLRQARNSSPWAVRISVSADDEATLDVISSVMAGTLDRANISLTWSEHERTAMVGSARSLIPLMMFPTGEFPGFEFVENEEFSLISQGKPESDIRMGSILWNGAKVSDFYLSRQALNRHAFICGMTGAGKTNTLFKIIEAINVPFLIIEPVKGEYRALRGKYKDAKIWTMRTSDYISDGMGILRINPFWFPKNASLTFHIDSIKTIISSAFELSAAMPNILEQCLYNIYIKAGWNLVTNKNMYEGDLPEEFLYPTFSDLTDEVEDYLDRSDFGDESLGDYKGALLSRLKSFTNGAKGLLLNTPAHPDYDELMTGRNIIELEGLSDDADKCLVMGTIMVQYYQYLKYRPQNDTWGKLRHILVIEESHRLFKNVSKRKNTTESADPTGQLVESLSNILAEIRAFGEGVLIVDQSPTKIAEDVIKNSGTKIVHRIDNEEDIKILQAAMLLPEDETSFPSLAQGEAMIRSEGMLRPCKVKIMRSDIKEGYNLSESFRVGETVNYELRNMFAATTLMQDERVAREVEKYCNRFVNSFAFIRWEDWKELTDSLLLKIMIALQEYKMDDIVEDRDVLYLLIPMSLKRIYASSNKKQLGYIHMFIMRLLELNADVREGNRVKEAAVKLLERYAKNYLTADVVYADYRQVSEEGAYGDFCSEIYTKNNPEKAMVIYKFYKFAKEWIAMSDETAENYDWSKENLSRIMLREFTLLDVEKYCEICAEELAEAEDALKDCSVHDICIE